MTKVTSYINSDRKYRKAKNPKNLKCLDKFSIKEFLELDIDKLKEEIELDRNNYYISFRLSILNENYYTIDRTQFINFLHKLKTNISTFYNNTTLQLMSIDELNETIESKFTNLILKTLIKEIDSEISVEIFAKYHGWANH